MYAYECKVAEIIMISGTYLFSVAVWNYNMLDICFQNEVYTVVFS
jgi:hypothetical protein